MATADQEGALAAPNGDSKGREKQPDDTSSHPPFTLKDFSRPEDEPKCFHAEAEARVPSAAELRALADARRHELSRLTIAPRKDGRRYQDRLSAPVDMVLLGRFQHLTQLSLERVFVEHLRLTSAEVPRMQCLWLEDLVWPLGCFATGALWLLPRRGGCRSTQLCPRSGGAANVHAAVTK